MPDIFQRFGLIQAYKIRDFLWDIPIFTTIFFRHFIHKKQKRAPQLSVARIGFFNRKNLVLRYTLYGSSRATLCSYPAPLDRYLEDTLLLAATAASHDSSRVLVGL